MDADERIAQVFEATEAELRRHYGATSPMHYGSMIRWRDGGPDPLDGISIYWHPDGHWHYLGFGMAERDEKVTPNPQVSGWGFELTFRLRAPAEVRALGDRASGVMAGVLDAAAAAPTWPIVLLNDVARYVYDSRRPLGHGHFIERPKFPHGRFWGVVSDPVLAPVETVNGRFVWLQLVRLSEGDFRRLQGDDFQNFLDEHAAREPLFVTED